MNYNTPCKNGTNCRYYARGTCWFDHPVKEEPKKPEKLRIYSAPFAKQYARVIMNDNEYYRFLRYCDTEDPDEDLLRLMLAYAEMEHGNNLYSIIDSRVKEEIKIFMNGGNDLISINQ